MFDTFLTPIFHETWHEFTQVCLHMSWKSKNWRTFHITGSHGHWKWLRYFL